MPTNPSWGERHQKLGCWIGIFLLFLAFEGFLYLFVPLTPPQGRLWYEMLKLNAAAVALIGILGAIEWIFNRLAEQAQRCPRCGGAMKIVAENVTTTTFRCPRCSSPPDLPSFLQ